jgi:hypothetical protein
MGEKEGEPVLGMDETSTICPVCEARYLSNDVRENPETPVADSVRANDYSRAALRLVPLDDCNAYLWGRQLLRSG